ncbi:SDR family oxidoreductase [Pseudaminobacter sp. 19-2017]|uniref:SDR family oxidoreductase n=1 Tax=Pseudaminobacter soli (ex Zhang et al. 2022) TaxID=2831468 RepID=A0A942IBW5_9HYPH|nr:SDR family NAD(P)-dependent oxidoreductase [Pseudaminobacter soli]MBS3652026.1 SDR family oxidoreductase [Pseudaminobacter soli]
MKNYGLKDRVVCITGGASGIGRAAAIALAGDGAHVAIVDLRDADIAPVLDELRSRGVKAAGFAMDVRDAAATKRAADHFERELGPVDGLFACAGISRTAPAEILPEADFEDVLEINLKGLFLTCREFGGRMVERGKGSIVVIGSVDGLGGHAGRLHYVSSKHGVSGLAKNLAIEWGRHGVRVNCIAPGFVDTPLLRRNMPPAFIDAVVDRTPLGRMGMAEEMASVALMLLSDAASFVTGAVLPIDGGLTSGFFTKKQGGDYSSKKLLEAGVYSE